MSGMNEIYRTIAEGYEKLAAGYRALADSGTDSEKVCPPEKMEKAVTIEVVRAAMSAKSDEGKTAQVKALLMKYDAGKLSGVNPKDYAALFREVEAL